MSVALHAAAALGLFAAALHVVLIVLAPAVRDAADGLARAKGRR